MLKEQLNQLYEEYGYRKFRMSKFEDYDLYAQNKDFLKKGHIITFTDGDGSLKALKPDITLSIMKNNSGDSEKVYYNENVYRETGGTFREILQVGVESVGQIDPYAEAEVIVLAAKSLRTISEDYVLDLSDVSFVGGLLEHTLSVAKMCDYFAGAYPMLNRDLLLTAAMFHDIGKTKELSVFPENDYTDDGQLLGHIIIGTEMVSERMRTIEGFPPKLATELKHCILAHHGELEYGSPKKPALLEAMALNFADNADAKMETMIEVLRGAGDNQGWLGYNRLLETNIRKTTEY